MSTLRDRRRQATEAEIEAAAIDLFEEAGYEATTCDDIAAGRTSRPGPSTATGEQGGSGLQEREAFDELIGDALCERASGGPLTPVAVEDAIAHLLAESCGEAWMVRMLRVRRLTSHDPALRRIAQHYDAECVDLVVRRLSEHDGARPEDLLRTRVTIATALTVFRAALDEWIARAPATVPP
ncbi:hypothetical protein ID871_27885 [Streptomyces pratensis]|nr:hypothetical protein [Streptomyces pratensis]